MSQATDDSHRAPPARDHPAETHPDGMTLDPTPAAPPAAPLDGARAWWEDGREPALLVALLGAVAQATVVLADLALTGRVSQLTDLCFVVVCLGMAVAVRLDQAFVVACCPLVLMVATMAVVGGSAPGAVAHATDTAAQATVTGLARHSVALVGGFLLGLATLGVRGLARGGRREATPPG